ncbi:hypothetical protein BU15DRAFT_43406 [Melanogaster broomeanus]|nr:hypothetical protein BU15DRAFT_43406 [Melanogaster broomeanus]
MVQTRKSGRGARTPATTTGTPSTTVSPFLSNANSVEPQTPETSDIERVTKVTTKTTTVSTSFVTRNSRKRAAEGDSDVEVTTKRRIVSNAVFVELPVRRSTLASKARLLNFASRQQHD